MPYNPNFGLPRQLPAGNYNPQFGVAPASSAPGGFEFGRLVDEYGNRSIRLRYEGDGHMVLIGKTGSGKDRRLITPNLLRIRDNRSIVCVDPKGEMAACTYPHRDKINRANGGRAVIINPFGVLCDYQGYSYMEGKGFNPLLAMNPRSPDFNKDAGLLAEALVKVTGNEKDPFFPVSARALVAGLIMYECVKALEQKRDPYLFNVRRMICEASADETPAKIVGGVVMKDAIPARGIPAYAMEMANSIIIGMRNKGGMFLNWSKEIQSVVSTARAETEFLDDPQIAYSLARKGFDFKTVKERPTTVYLVLPMDVMERHGKWLRLMLTAALHACMRPRAKGEPKTLFILNEFASMGHLSLIETNFTVVRGAGIQLLPVVQDIGQLKAIYGNERWETFLGNADVIATFAPNEAQTAKYFSERSGEVGIFKTNTAENWGNSGGNSQTTGTSPTGETGGTGLNGGWTYGCTANHSYEKLPAVTPRDLYSMQTGEMRIIRANMGDTIRAHARPYDQMDGLLAEARPEPNPYHTHVERIDWQMPDYKGFMRKMLNVYQPVAEIGGGSGYAPEPASPAGDGDYVDDGTWGQSNSDGWFYDPNEVAPDTPEGGGWE